MSGAISQPGLLGDVLGWGNPSQRGQGLLDLPAVPFAPGAMFGVGGPYEQALAARQQQGAVPQQPQLPGLGQYGGAMGQLGQLYGVSSQQLPEFIQQVAGQVKANPSGLWQNIAQGVADSMQGGGRGRDRG